MSFAAQTKKELTLIHEDSCCRRSELESMVALNGKLITIDGRTALEIETENAATARRMYTHLREEFDIHPEVLVRKKMRLRKNNVYALRIPSRVDDFLRELGWGLDDSAARDLAVVGDGLAAADGIRSSRPSGQSLQKVLVSAAAGSRKRKSCCKRAYLRGAFLASGSVNDPGSTSYHLEITTDSESFARNIQKMMNEHALHAKVIGRKRGYVVYLKEGEKIVDFLSLIGAHQALLKFEDVRILKGMRNQVNRLVNCETANMNKTIGAAVRQLESIQLIEDHLGLSSLSDKLREVAELRMQNPEVNLQELAERLGNKVSKSGLNHRFRKLEEIADKLRNRAE